MWAYRRVLRVSLTAMKTNKWVLDKIGNSLVLRSQMMERKLKFFGHVKVLRRGSSREWSRQRESEGYHQGSGWTTSTAGLA